MVKYINEKYHPLDQADMIGSAYSGNIEILKYFLENGFKIEDPQLCLVAANEGHLEYLRFAVDHNAPLSERLTQLVAEFDDVNLLRELRLKGCMGDLFMEVTTGLFFFQQ